MYITDIQHIVFYFRNKFTLWIFIACSVHSVFSQKLNAWQIQNFTFLDNREFFNPYAEPKTIFGTRLDLSAGMSLDSIHSVQGGGDFLYEFGENYTETKFYPTLYYHYKGKRINFVFGAFPRVRNLRYPRILHNDTLQYYRPNLEGALVSLKLKRGFQKVWIDWLSRITKDQGESFMAGTYGKLHFGDFFFENYYYMYHYADLVTRNVRDNGGALLLLGYDLRKDYNISLSGGLAISDDRIRPKQFYYSFGFYSRTEFFYKKRYKASMTYYKGMPVSLANGDHFYKAGTYMRLDASASLINKENIQLLFQFSGHFVDYNLDMSQKLALFISFGDQANSRSIQLHDMYF